MSAFVVSKAHIDLLVTVALYGPQDGEATWHRLTWYRTPADLRDANWRERYREATVERADEIGQMLVWENVASVRHRYPSANERLPGSVDRYWQESYKHTTSRRPTAVEALKAVSCYEYQACEHPVWENSEAAQFCGALRRALIAALPGYDEAPWEWTEENVLMGATLRSAALGPPHRQVRTSRRG